MSFQTVENPTRAMNRAEKTVYGRLVDQVRADNIYVFANVPWVDARDDREFDFLVSIPGVGIGFIEVKGGQVQIVGNEWKQYSPTDHGYVARNFGHQIGEERRALRGLLGEVFPKGKPRYGYVLAMPEIDFPTDQYFPGMSRDTVIHAGNIEDLYATLVANIQEGWGHDGYSALDQEALIAAIAVRGEQYEDVVATTSARSGVVDAMSREQAFVLEMLVDNERVLVSGGPGTGKTVVAIEEAVRLTHEGKRVGLLCYNRGLAAVLKDKVKDLPDYSKPALVGTLLDGMRMAAGMGEVTAPEEQAARDLFWKVDFPDAVARAVAAMPYEDKFDCLVIDEAQDIAQHAWPIIENALRDPQHGRVILFGDQEQDIFHGVKAPWPVARVTLRDNLRSSRKIADALNAFYDQGLHPAGPIQGVEPELHIVANVDDVLSAVDAYIDQLVTEYQWRRGDIAVLTTRKLHQKHLDAREAGDDAYWAAYLAGEDVFYSHVNTFKGLERPFVILAVNGFSGQLSSDPHRTLFVGAGRARDDLAIFGTAEDLEKLGQARHAMRDSGE